METNCYDGAYAHDNPQKKIDDLARNIIEQIADKWTILVIDVRPVRMARPPLARPELIATVSPPVKSCEKIAHNCAQSSSNRWDF